MNRILVGTILICALHGAHAGEDRRYHNLGLTIASDVKRTLVESGVCGSESECTRESRVLFVSSSKGLHFEIYGATEAPAIGRLLDVLGRQGRALPAGALLEAKFISTTKAVDLKRSLYEKQPVHVRLEIVGTQ